MIYSIQSTANAREIDMYTTIMSDKIKGQTKVFDEGEIIIEEGDYGNEAFELISGKVEISCQKEDGEKVVVAILQAPHIFGEMALIEEKPRSATVKALDSVVVKITDKETFRKAILNDPEATIPILRFMFERLRTQNEAFLNIAKSSSASFQDIMLPYMMQGQAIITMVPQTKEAQQALGDEMLEITHLPYRIGRQTRDNDLFSYNDLLLNDEEPYQISPNHLMITRTNGHFVVSDRGSRYGSIINGKRIGRTNRKDVVELKQGENVMVLGDIYPKYRYKLVVDYTNDPDSN